MNGEVLEILVLTANRLDELGHEKEAEALDEYLYALAGGKENEDPLAKMVALANDLDCSGDETLQKYASVLDEIMLTIGAPKNAKHEFESRAEAEIERLREKYHSERGDELYKERTDKELRQDQNQQEATAKAYADQVKKYKTLEAPLSTRYCPDHPGAMMIHVADRVYQCEMDKKMYNFQTGFTTNKGNEIPGGGVEFQVKDWGNRDLGHAMFDTRESKMSRFASAEDTADTDDNAVKDYELGTRGEDKTIEIRVKPGTSEARKQEIAQEVAGSFGSAPVRFVVVDHFESEG